MGLENGRMLADIMGKRLFREKASSGVRKLTLPLSLRGGGVLKKRTQQVSDNVGSEVTSRDLDLRTTYFRCGGYIKISYPSKLSGERFDQTDQNKS